MKYYLYLIPFILFLSCTMPNFLNFTSYDPSSPEMPPAVSKDFIKGYWKDTVYSYYGLDTPSVIIAFYTDTNYYLKIANKYLYGLTYVLYEECGTYSISDHQILFIKNKYFRITIDTNHTLDTFVDTTGNYHFLYDDYFTYDSIRLIRYNKVDKTGHYEISYDKYFYRKDSSEIISNIWLNLNKP